MGKITLGERIHDIGENIRDNRNKRWAQVEDARKQKLGQIREAAYKSELANLTRTGEKDNDNIDDIMFYYKSNLAKANDRRKRWDASENEGLKCLLRCSAVAASVGVGLCLEGLYGVLTSQPFNTDSPTAILSLFLSGYSLYSMDLGSPRSIPYVINYKNDKRVAREEGRLYAAMQHCFDDWFDGNVLNFFEEHPLHGGEGLTDALIDYFNKGEGAPESSLSDSNGCGGDLVDGPTPEA